MGNTNLEALNALIEKIRAGEGTAESNLEALNMLCVLSGGTGKAKSNLEALNELLTVFEAAKPEQVKSVAITENGTTTVTPDDGHVLSSVNVDVNVPSKPEQAKSVSITENGTTEITPDEGYTLSGASVSVNVSSGSSEYNVCVPSLIDTSEYFCIYQHITKINLDGIRINTANRLSNLFSGLIGLTTVIWGNFIDSIDHKLSLDTSALFSGCKSLETVDISVFKGRNLSGVSSMFSGAVSLKSIDLNGVIISANNLGNMFYRCLAIEYIKLPILSPDVRSVQNTFFNCTALKTLILPDGCFSNESITSLDLSYSPLTHDCAVDIFNKLATRTNSPTLKLSTTTKGYLTDDEIAVATGKGWVIS